MQCRERALREENARRKQNRILQVREQSKEIAAKLRKRINEEKERQKDHVEKIKIDEMRKWKDTRVGEVQAHYDRIIGSSIDANEEARREVEAQHRYEQRKQELDLIAAQRGRDALRKELAEHKHPQKPAKARPRCVSTQVQTDRMEAIPVEKELKSRCVHVEIPQEDLPPESVDCDDPISARSVDILEKSKRFVEDATRRLDEISAKVACCQQMQPQAEKEEREEQVHRVPIVKRDVVRPKPVKTNAASRLRADAQRKSATPPKAVVNRIKKIIPSAKETAITSSGPSHGSVLMYDHPNRFTKTYDIPKNIVVKNTRTEDNNEEDAVTNALNETLNNIEEENSKLARAQDLKHKESIRQLEALEKSQVRRDYEMLAKTLEDVRKNRSSSPSAAQFVPGGFSYTAPKNHTNDELAAANHEIVHVPIRISCPKVGAQVNVGEPVENFSSSDSAQSILLDQICSLRSKKHSHNNLQMQPEIIVENKNPNVKVHAVKPVDVGIQPVKIIIQVENLVRPGEAVPEVNANLPVKPMLLSGAVNESLSTNYMSPPSELGTDVGKLLNPKRKAVKSATKKKPQAKQNKPIKKYIEQLLQMPQNDVEKMSDNDVSDIPTPSESLLNVPANIPEMVCDHKKLSSVGKLIEDNYSMLEELDELIAQNSPKKKKDTPSTSSAPATDSLLQRYASMSQTYTDRIESLNKMINVIRKEKENIMQENGLSNVTTSERDTSTKYKDFGSMARTMTPSSSELSDELDEAQPEFHRHKDTCAGKPGNLGANKGIGRSRDSGISVSRPVTSTDLRATPEEKVFEPILKDIPKQHPLKSPVAVMEVERKRPPNSITRYTPDAIQASGHDLSTILEVDTPATVNIGSAEQIHADVKKFPTMEEFLDQNKTNISGLSEIDRGEFGHIRPFVSFKHFVENEEGAGSTRREMELNLSEIADELRRRSLLQNDEAEKSKQEEDKDYLRNLSRELEEMIARIKSHQMNEPNLSQLSVASFKSILSDHGSGNDSTGKLLDKIKPSKFPTREEFNRMNNSKHYNSAEILRSFLNESNPNEETERSEKRQMRSPRKNKISVEETAMVPTTCAAKYDEEIVCREKPFCKSPKKNKDVTEAHQGASLKSPTGSSSKKSTDSTKSQPVNMNDDLMNALENNLSEMGLKWAVNMLKRSHTHLSSSSGTSSDNEMSKENIPFESKTMSLLSDLEKSSISDEVKTNNIKTILLRELIRRNESGNSSSSTTLSSTGRKLLDDTNGTGSEDGRKLRTSTPVNSNLFHSVSTSTMIDKGERTLAAVDSSDCLFSGESKLSSVRDDVATLSNFKLNVPEVRLNVGKYAPQTDSTLSTEYSLNEHNKRKLNRRTDK